MWGSRGFFQGGEPLTEKGRKHFPPTKGTAMIEKKEGIFLWRRRKKGSLW